MQHSPREGASNWSGAYHSGVSDRGQWHSDWEGEGQALEISYSGYIFFVVEYFTYDHNYLYLQCKQQPRK